jgi:hypothetical protein
MFRAIIKLCLQWRQRLPKKLRANGCESSGRAASVGHNRSLHVVFRSRGALQVFLQGYADAFRVYGQSQTR